MSRLYPIVEERSEIENDISHSELSDSTDIKAEILATLRQELKAALKAERPPQNSGIATTFADSVALVGLKEALTWQHQPLRSVWIMLLLGGFAATVFFIYRNAYEYLNKEVATKISLAFSAEYEYPPLVLCPPTFFSVDQLTAMGLSTNGLIYALGYAFLSQTYLDQGPEGLGPVSARMVLQGFPENSTPLHKIANDGRADFLAFYKKHKFSSLADFYKSMAVNVTDFTDIRSPFILRSCYGCDDRHVLFKKIIVFNNAICYAFTLKNATPARAFDTHLILSMRIGDQNRRLSAALNHDWRMGLYLGQDSENPSIILGSNSKYTLKIHAQRMIRLTNESNCVDKSDPSNSQYDQGACVTSCLDDVGVSAGINHTSLMMPRHPEEMRNTFTYASRETGIVGNDTDDARHALKAECYKKCLPPCDKTTYDVSVHYNGHDPHLSESTNESTLHLIVTHAAVSQGGLITWQEIETMTFSDFVSNVGGILALFLGCSIMTFAQLVLSMINYALNQRTPNRRSCDTKSSV